LHYLDEPADDATADLLERLARVRKQLEKLAVQAATEPSTVSLQGQRSVEASLAAIAEQTGNNVALSGETTTELAQKKIDWNQTEITFWQAMQLLQQKANLQIDPYAADARQLRLRERLERPNAPNAASEAIDTGTIETSAGVFQFQIVRVDSTYNLQTPDVSFTSAHLLVRWEPRVRPINVKLAAKHITARGPHGELLPVANPDAVFSALVQPQIPQLELVVPLKRIDRGIETIASFKAKFEATLPGRTETFSFAHAGKQTPGTRQEKAGAIVTLEGVDKNEDLFGVTVSLAFDEELNALESHQSWVFENQVFLRDEQDQRSDPLTYETIRQDNSGVTVTYYFADDPNDRTLVYQTPAAIVQSISEIELKDIPLP
jgi:hypothetical protein